MNMKKNAALFLDAVSKYTSIAIYIPGSPDPDAIASAYALKLILKQFSIDSDIFAEKRLSLPQNQAFIDSLKIPVIFDRDKNLRKYQAYIVADFQNNSIESIGDSLPCAAHIDHHAKLKKGRQADFSLVRTDAGSTSTLVALIFRNLNINLPEKEMKNMATALLFGIQTDTDNYNKISSLDFEALNYLSGFADIIILEGINRMPLSSATLKYYTMAKENEVVYRDWAFYGIGYLDANFRDSIAVSADLILRNSEYKMVAVFAIIENHKKGEMYLDVSLRAESSAVDLNRVIKRITPNGGGRRYKGAYQVKLNYFLGAPDRKMLWQVVEATTLETLSRSRDTLYITGLESLYGGIRERVLTFLKKDSDKD